jgi:uncharacterized protein YhhL (DUF1145 family)
MNVGKAAVAVFWLAWILSLVSVIPSHYGSTIVFLGGLVLVVHLFEYLLVKSKFAERGGDGISFVQTLLFGFAHWLPLLKQPK